MAKASKQIAMWVFLNSSFDFWGVSVLRILAIYSQQSLRNWRSCRRESWPFATFVSFLGSCVLYVYDLYVWFQPPNGTNVMTRAPGSRTAEGTPERLEEWGLQSWLIQVHNPNFVALALFLFSFSHADDYFILVSRTFRGRAWTSRNIISSTVSRNEGRRHFQQLIVRMETYGGCVFKTFFLVFSRGWRGADAETIGRRDSGQDSLRTSQSSSKRWKRNLKLWVWLYWGRRQSNWCRRTRDIVGCEWEIRVYACDWRFGEN